MSGKVSVFGLGYVGSVTAACLASKGNSVIGVDLSASKVEQLEAGHSPIVEPRMKELVESAHAASSLHATIGLRACDDESEISFLCVGTPSLRNGKLDLGHIEPVCREIGRILKNKNAFHLVVSSQHGTTRDGRNHYYSRSRKISGKKMGKDFGVCVNPEFMREGTAVADFLEPAMTVIGAADSQHAAFS